MAEKQFKRRSRGGALTALAVTGSLCAVGLVVPAEATPTPTPTLRLERTLATDPFPRSDLDMTDHEGSAYVPRDDSFWLADDDGRSLYEVDATTGLLKRKVRGAELAAVQEEGGGAPAGQARTGDIQALVYDDAKDLLYAFSGTCCMPGLLPTAFRLRRSGGSLELESYQPLPDVQVAAAAWNPADGKVYLGADSSLRTYGYVTNSAGPAFTVPGVSSIYGMDFSDDGRDLFVARPPSHVTRIDWATRSIVPGWDLDLAPFGVLDARGVEVVAERLWVSDGFDGRPAGDPLSHALFVLSVGGTGTAGTPGTPGTPTPPPPGTPVPGQDLVGNPGFERDLRGWDASGRSGVKLERVNEGHRGSWSARVTRTNGQGRIGLTDAPEWAGTSRAGTYASSLWVRSSKPGATLSLRLREQRGDQKIGQSLVRIELRKKWQRVSVSLVTRTPGRSTVDYSATVHGAARGSSFDADDARLTLSP